MINEPNSKNYLKLFVDNFYYQNSNYIYVSGPVTYSISARNKETDEINVITTLEIISQSPIPSLMETSTKSSSETPITNKNTHTIFIRDNNQNSINSKHSSFENQTDLFFDFSA